MKSWILLINKTLLYSISVNGHFLSKTQLINIYVSDWPRYECWICIKTKQTLIFDICANDQKERFYQSNLYRIIRVISWKHCKLCLNIKISLSCSLIIYLIYVFIYLIIKILFTFCILVKKGRLNITYKIKQVISYIARFRYVYYHQYKNKKARNIESLIKWQWEIMHY